MSKSPSGRHAGRQETLIAAAAEVFADQGYHAATVAEIARRAHVATGTFYLYFPSKEICFSGLLARFYAEVLDEVRARRRGAPSVLHKLDRSVAAVLECFRRERSLATVVLVQASGAPQDLKDKLRAIEAELVGLLADDLEEAAGVGLIPPGDAALRARLVLGTMREALVCELSGDHSAARLDGEVRRFLLRAVGGAAAAVEETGQATS